MMTSSQTLLSFSKRTCKESLTGEAGAVICPGFFCVMKFAIQEPNFSHANITQQKSLCSCGCCGALTRWVDCDLFSTPVCALECDEQLWRDHLSSSPSAVQSLRQKLFELEIDEEWEISNRYQNATKDILVVVHDQLDYLKKCVQSIQSHTRDYKLFIWDNNSRSETQRYIATLDAEVVWSEINEGFIKPNNALAKMGQSDYIICLNSDTEVFAGWDAHLCGFLQKHPDVAQVGCLGGLLESDGTGSYTNFGYDIDYVLGWCFCMRRSLCESTGLFNEEMQFAYFEDADLSLRLKSLGHKLYALHSPVVHHYGNKTVAQAALELDLMPNISFNHSIIKEKWSRYLAEDRAHSPRNPRIWSSPGNAFKPNP